MHCCCPVKDRVQTARHRLRPDELTRWLANDGMSSDDSLVRRKEQVDASKQRSVVSMQQMMIEPSGCCWLESDSVPPDNSPVRLK
jgi:hypothetical protein